MKSGMKQCILDIFSGGSDADLATLGWTKVTGAGTIRSDGAGTAYSSSSGALGIVAHYVNSSTGYTANRKIKCQTLGTSAGVAWAQFGIMIRMTGAKAYTSVIQKYNSATGNDDFIYQINYGAAVGTAIGSLVLGLHQYEIITRGNNLFIDIDAGALTYNTSFVGGTTNDPSGLYYTFPLASLGTKLGNWKNFDVRLYPFGGE